jgi:hypothetical protein
MNPSSASEIGRILDNASDIGRLKEQSDASKQDRRDLWENMSVLRDSISAFRDVAAQNGLILSKITDLGKSQDALTEKLVQHGDKFDARLTALERRDERGKGAMAVLLAIASGIGAVFAVSLQWALNHFWPAGRP